MKTKDKTRAVPTITKLVTGQNVLRLMKQVYSDRDYPNVTSKAIALAKAAGIGKNTVLRLVNPQEPTSPSVDIIEALARELGVNPYQLLIPHLDPKNPQVAHVPNGSEREWYGKIPAIKDQEPSE